VINNLQILIRLFIQRVFLIVINSTSYFWNAIKATSRYKITSLPV